MECPDAEAVEGMVGGGGGEHQQAVRVKTAQGPCRIHAVLVSHINVKEHKAEPFPSGGGKEVRAGNKT